MKFLRLQPPFCHGNFHTETQRRRVVKRSAVLVRIGLTHAIPPLRRIAPLTINHCKSLNLSYLVKIADDPTRITHSPKVVYPRLAASLRQPNLLAEDVAVQIAWILLLWRMVKGYVFDQNANVRRQFPQRVFLLEVVAVVETVRPVSRRTGIAH